MTDTKSPPPPSRPEGPEHKGMIPQESHELSAPGSGRDLYPGIAAAAFEDKSRKILDRDFEWNELEIRPDGVIYAPAIRFRDRLDEAFGQGRWALQRRTNWSDPRQTGNVIMATFHLIVDGRFICEATGGMSYHPNNKQMSYDDAIEGAESNARMRCCKKIGIGKNLWDPNYRREWRKKNAVRAWCVNKQDGKGKFLWHRVDDPDAIAWPWEIKGGAPQMKEPKQRSGAGRSTGKPATAQTPPPPAPDAKNDLFEDEGPSAANTGVDEKSLACTILKAEPGKKVGSQTIYHFRVKDETGMESWVTTNKSEVADVLRSCLSNKNDAEITVRDHPTGARELLTAHPIIDA